MVWRAIALLLAGYVCTGQGRKAQPTRGRYFEVELQWPNSQRRLGGRDSLEALGQALLALNPAATYNLAGNPTHAESGRMVSALTVPFDRPSDTWGAVSKRPGVVMSMGSQVASLGIAGGLTYWCFKLLKHSILTCLAWYTISMRTGNSPRKQKGEFAAVYATLYAASTALQPLKWTGIVACAPFMNRLLERLAVPLGMTKARAFVFLVINLIGGALLPLGVLLASALSKVPI